MVSTKLRENRGIHAHHDRSPSNTKSGQENSRSYLVRDNRRGWLEDGVRDEENQSRNRVSVAFVGSKIVMHASDCGVWPDQLLEKHLMWLVARGGTYMLPLSIRDTQYINLEEAPVSMTSKISCDMSNL